MSDYLYTGLTLSVREVPDADGLAAGVTDDQGNAPASTLEFGVDLGGYFHVLAVEKAGHVLPQVAAAQAQASASTPSESGAVTGTQ